MKLYLITGFLGAGKTTFLKNFVHQFDGQKLWLIINDFGKIGVDADLLQKVNAVKSEISNGSIFCACRLDKFEEALQQAAADQPDVILVEASGLADPTGVEKVLDQEEFAQITYCGSVCLIDTPRLERVIHTARVLPKQIAVSSLILLNKSDLAAEELVQQAKQTIRRYNPEAVIHKTEFGTFKDSWLGDIRVLSSGEPDRMPDIQLQKQAVRIDRTMTLNQLHSALKIIAEESWRIKGFVELEGRHYLVNCVGPSIHITETELHGEEENHLVLLAGPGMALRKSIKEAIKWYPQIVKE